MPDSKKPHGAIDTAKFSFNFLSDNFDHFIDVLKPLIPVLLISVWLSGAIDPADDAYNPPWLIATAILANVAAYIYTIAFIITWHRSVIHGPKNADKANPLRFTKSEWGFLLMGIALFLAFFAVGFAGGFVLAIIGAAFMPLAIILGVVGLVTLLVYATRLYLYFPAKAAGADITLREALEIGKGITAKLIGSMLIAGLVIGLMAFVMLVVIGLVVGLITGIPETVTDRLITSLLMSPFQLFIQMLGAAVTVGILSRYYMWAVQEKSV